MVRSFIFALLFKLRLLAKRMRVGSERKRECPARRVGALISLGFMAHDALYRGKEIELPTMNRKDENPQTV
jgi:hypothetical protein